MARLLWRGSELQTRGEQRFVTTHLMSPHARDNCGSSPKPAGGTTVARSCVLSSLKECSFCNPAKTRRLSSLSRLTLAVGSSLVGCEPRVRGSGLLSRTALKWRERLRPFCERFLSGAAAPMEEITSEAFEIPLVLRPSEDKPALRGERDHLVPFIGAEGG